MDKALVSERIGPVEAVSVGDLVRKRLDPDDPWRLALVQRHLVWDEVRIARLLDSLLAGYPIGTILVCRVGAGGKALEDHGGSRKAVDVDRSSWQLLDGQQRINALITIFSDQGRFGRFLVDMTAIRQREDVVTRRRDKRGVTRYIVWRDDESGGEEIPRRDRHLDLSRWLAWAGAREEDEIRAAAVAGSADTVKLLTTLNEIDPEFADALEAHEVAIAIRRLVRLAEIWIDKAIPVQYLSLEDAVDVLQVFSRVNLEGVRVDGEDVFFAAVKTLWNDAEENLDRVAGRSALISRVTALRILARLASRSLKQGDLMPLRVDRLNGPKGQRLVETMRRIARDDGPALGRIGRVGRWLAEDSKVGYGLRSVNALLFDHVFAWAAVNERLDEDAQSADWLLQVEGFLVGAQAFRWPSILGDTFSRLAFERAVTAGANGEPFPVEAIVSAARAQWPGLTVGRRTVQADADDHDHRALASANAELFLSIVQRLPYEPPVRDPSKGPARREVEWDHIYPQALASRMRIKDPKSGYPVHHPLRRLVWTVGNLWALDRPLNGRASDSWPSEKFELLEKEAGTNRLPTRWPEEHDAFLSDDGLKHLLDAERLVQAKEIDAAMDAFQAYARSRSLRIYKEVMNEVESAGRFSPGALVDLDPGERPAVIDVAQALGVDVPEPTSADLAEDAPELASGADGAFAAVDALATSIGVLEPLRRVVVAARELGLYARPYKASVMFTPSGNRTRMLFTLWPTRNAGGGFEIYRWANAFVQFFPELDEQAVRDSIGPDKWGFLAVDEVEGLITGLRTLLTERTESTGAVTNLDPALSGDEIRDAADAFLRESDPERRGIHYYEITKAVQATGRVAGKNPPSAVLGAMRRDGQRFEWTSDGTYTWRGEAARTRAPIENGRYWVMRTDRNRAETIWEEARAGRLRQGWGWDPDMDLRTIRTAVTSGAALTDWQQQSWRNRRMLTSESDGIHPGDVVLAPHLPEPGQFSLFRVTGEYDFDDGRAFGDYGHILPVELLPGAIVSHSDPRLSPRFQGTLGNRTRLWNIDAFGGEIEGLTHEGSVVPS